MSFPEFSIYKDSGCPRIGDVPAHWDVSPCRAIVEERVEKNTNGSISEYLSLMANIGVIRYEDKGDVGNKKPEDLGKCKIVRKGNLVINSMNYGIGSYGLSPYDGVCSPVYIVLDPIQGRVIPRFALRVFEDKSFQSWAQSFGNGILAHRSAIGWNDLKNIKIALPPIDEQQKLAQFLDHETAKIDALIAEQQRLIELLKEKRQAVISHAVTKGLNPSAPMKDSGVEWLGEVPEHWEVVAFARLINRIEQGWSPNAINEPSGEGDWGVLKLSSVKKGLFYKDENKCLPPEITPDESIKVCEGDLLITRANTPDLVGDACIVNGLGDSRLMLSDLIYRVNLNSRAVDGFLCWCLTSDLGRQQIKLDARGSSMSMAKISQGHIKAWKFPLPPISEQLEIVSYIASQTSGLDELILESGRMMDLLIERRSTLISGAVTGKIDVRDWQPSESTSVEPVLKAAEESASYG